MEPLTQPQLRLSKLDPQFHIAPPPAPSFPLFLKAPPINNAPSLRSNSSLSYGPRPLSSSSLDPAPFKIPGTENHRSPPPARAKPRPPGPALHSWLHLFLEEALSVA